MIANITHGSWVHLSNTTVPSLLSVRASLTYTVEIYIYRLVFDTVVDDGLPYFVLTCLCDSLFRMVY